MKVTIVGAGNVGATCADVISYRGIASEVVLLDIKEGFAEGKALDGICNVPPILVFTKYRVLPMIIQKTANSSVVNYSGIPRKPGMTREELIGINAGIVKQLLKVCWFILQMQLL
jgi:malate dehydrogenase